MLSKPCQRMQFYTSEMGAKVVGSSRTSLTCAERIVTTTAIVLLRLSLQASGKTEDRRVVPVFDPYEGVKDANILGLGKLPGD